MAATAQDPELLLERVQELQAQLDSTPGDVPRELHDALVGVLLDLHGAGIERMLAVHGNPGQLTGDPLVATLLLIHDLHPVPLADRVAAALDSVRPYMESHGGGVTLRSLEGGVARIALRGSCSSCQASTATLELAIRQALEEQAPDLVALEVEGLAPETERVAAPPGPCADGGPAGVELPMVQV